MVMPWIILNQEKKITEPEAQNIIRNGVSLYSIFLEPFLQSL
jgi:hypothetical protein